ncbi:hypothetical protein Halru_1606 [Halovivax ruber XH-70]|uniref:DUF7344 domain-containing protein n=1 Tax=Halovivax ruber (strain DSM 18193 / JCM 13892 / XH-70) TaxID=797302 RepID=L0IBL7_HALRX|nr:hypothetical protein [Halovivax ruber]AGB16213.1 hypothetical protein Halru_1606 [Halovivax ruber XH-70]
MSTNELTQAELFDVFSNARRRMAVRYLTECNGSCDLTPLVEQVAAWENGLSRTEVDRAQRRRVYISLYQTHLPMLEDHGIVDWDPDAHRITLRHDGRVFTPYLGRRPDGSSWQRPYALVAVGAAAALSLAVLSVGPVTTGIAPLVAMVTCVLFLAVALVRRRSPIAVSSTGR